MFATPAEVARRDGGEEEGEGEDGGGGGVASAETEALRRARVLWEEAREGADALGLGVV